MVTTTTTTNQAVTVTVSPALSRVIGYVQSGGQMPEVERREVLRRLDRYVDEGARKVRLID